MKKTIVVYSFLTVFLAFCFFLAYLNRAKVTSFLLSKNFGFPLTIQELYISSHGVKVKNLTINNIKKSSKYNPALFCQTIKIKTTLKQLRQKILAIDEISLNKIDLNIQFYDNARSLSNFNDIIEAKTPNLHKKKKRAYLVQKLILNDLDVQLIFYNGKITKVHIPKLVFYNISEKSGFPVEQLEKAILHAIVRSIFDKFGIKNILRNVSPENLLPKIDPRNMIPKILPFSS